jgi:hypothetical protein
MKTVGEIAMKKPKMMADLLVVADVCIEAFEAQARLLESLGKGTSRKKHDREVNIADRAIPRTEDTVDIKANNPHIRKRRSLFGVPMMRRSGARFTAPRGMTWKSVRFF